MEKIIRSSKKLDILNILLSQLSQMYKRNDTMTLPHYK